MYARHIAVLWGIASMFLGAILVKKRSLLISILFLLVASVALSQTTSFLSIPSSGFTPLNSEGTGNAGYSGNQTGTARLFAGSFLMLAPVNLPHGATVTSMRCGGRAPSSDFRIVFTLRRNEPQQANVDMATVMTTLGQTTFQFVDTSSITSPVIADNASFNYYIVAATDNLDVGFARTAPSASAGSPTPSSSELEEKGSSHHRASLALGS